MQADRLLVCLLVAPASGSLSSLRLISFDLDDTLWPTGPVVQAANGALASAVGTTPEELQSRLKMARTGANPPPSYSEARTIAIECWLIERDGPSPSRRAEAEHFFQSWLAARHTAAEDLLFDGAAEAVAAVRAQHPEAIIAAITNGRGDPLAMPALRKHFDFTVSAEDVGIYPARKPAAAPFLAALRKAGVEAKPALWAHVGDDLLNDVQAAKRLGAWSIWLDPSGGGEDGAPAASPDFWFSTMSESERAERTKRAEAARGTADVIIRNIGELPTALSPASRRRGRACPFPMSGAP